MSSDSRKRLLALVLVGSLLAAESSIVAAPPWPELLVPTQAGASDGSSPRLPNIVLILADDLGTGDIGAYNPASKIPTPRLDRLAREAMRFWDASTPSGVCSPTRYGLLTGRYAWRSPLKRWTLDGWSKALIEPSRPTLATQLQAKGYATSCVGKWHLGFQDGAPTDSSDRVDYTKALSPGPLSTGFQRFFGIPASLDMDPYLFVDGDRAESAPSGFVAASAMRRNGGEGFWRAGPIAPGFRHADVLERLADRAVRWIEEAAAKPEKRPFFLYFPLTAPHTPWLPTQPWRGKSGAGPYGDFVCQVDGVVGRILDTLTRLGLEENTLVIFTSDNGAHWLPADIERYQHRANLDFRGQKADIWEGGHRVPLLIRWPGHVQPGDSRRLVCLVDLFATISAAVGAAVPAGAAEDSLSFLPELLGKPFETPPRQSVVLHSGDGLFAIRKGDWKLVEGLGSGGFTPPKTEAPAPGGPRGQLYDLREDPGERRNVYLERPEMVESLTRLLEETRSR